ncbi:hypothetical protein SEA_BATSTARR_43 [Gordonia phage BatStarr]|nr:hypothetical protein SEA_BATSTARR_43 [Gordonia phage BatStarr]
MVTVMTYPNPSEKYEETVCVAGVRLDGGEPRWIRLYPMRIRNVDEGWQFKKYDVIELDVQPHGSKDPRIESYRPDQSKLRVVDHVAAEGDWTRRRELLANLRGATTTCSLVAEASEAPMNAPARSLGMIRPTVSHVEVKPGQPWTPEQQRKIDAVSGQEVLFGTPMTPLEPMPFVVRYHYSCQEPACRGHDQKVLDWELGQAGRKWFRRYGDETIEKIRHKWERQMVASDRDLHFFIGNQHQHRRSFSVLGTWWPARRPEQISLFEPVPYT